MIGFRAVESDEDVEAWLHVRRVVVPTESAGTVELFRERAQAHSEQLYLLAERDGRLAASGIAGMSDAAGRGFVAPRVLPGARRNGVGAALLHVLADHVAGLGVDRVGAHVDDDGSRTFAERFGFEELDRQVEQVARIVGSCPVRGAAGRLSRAAGLRPGALRVNSAWHRKDPGNRPKREFRLNSAWHRKELPDGIEVTTIAERPELLEAAYPLALEGWADFATAEAVTISLEDWLCDEATLPGGSFVALAGGEIVGFSGLCRHDEDGVAEDGLTVVRRDWRRSGLARALKSLELDSAAANGYRAVITWTQQGNGGMRAVNEALGYEYRGVSVTMVAPPSAAWRHRPCFVKPS